MVGIVGSKSEPSQDGATRMPIGFPDGQDGAGRTRGGAPSGMAGAAHRIRV
ncbi:hypothetical protein C7S17_6826 [Burkholderia thailandensis]|nr:hypothetical protein [Burkholderia thailandensis]